MLSELRNTSEQRARFGLSDGAWEEAMAFIGQSPLQCFVAAVGPSAPTRSPGEIIVTSTGVLAGGVEVEGAMCGPCRPSACYHDSCNIGGCVRSRPREASSYAISTIRSSCPPTNLRSPQTCRMSAPLTPYCCAARSACFRKLE
jgi:hypothetical protein